MNIEKKRAEARRLCNDSRVAVIPYGNAWWLVGNGINRVVGELAGLTATELCRFPVTRR